VTGDRRKAVILNAVKNLDVALRCFAPLNMTSLPIPDPSPETTVGGRADTRHPAPDTCHPSYGSTFALTGLLHGLVVPSTYFQRNR
jgi:hypothetical protein